MESPAFSGDWNSRAAMHRGDAPSRIAAVLDVVMDEKPVVQHLQAGGGRKRVLGAPAQRSRRRDAEGRAQTLARSPKKISHEPVKMPLRLPARDSLRKRIAEHVAIPAQALEKARRSKDVARARQRLGDLRASRAEARTSRRTGVSRPGRPRPVRARPAGRDRSARARSRRRSRTARHVQAAGAPARAAATRRGLRGPRPARANRPTAGRLGIALRRTSRHG